VVCNTISGSADATVWQGLLAGLQAHFLCKAYTIEKEEEVEMNIRSARTSDAEELLDIYCPYVLNTAISFEYQVPTVKEFESRIANTLKRYPYLVLEDQGQIVGYTYASPFKQRKAYDWAVETSIYIREDCRGMGYGKALYQALENSLRKQNILNMNACIAYTEEKDSHLTNKSMGFHEHLGFTLVGRFHQCGFKFGNWYDMIWMEKILGEHVSEPKPVADYHSDSL
jgi:phosphinothricin acetyltransferase